MVAKTVVDFVGGPQKLTARLGPRDVGLLVPRALSSAGGQDYFETLEFRGLRKLFFRGNKEQSPPVVRQDHGRAQLQCVRRPERMYRDDSLGSRSASAPTRHKRR